MSVRRILLVDDDPVTLLTVGTRLRAVGYEVVAHEGSMGVYLKASHVKPDVAIVDVNMPGISGEGVMELLQGVSPKPLLMVYSSLPEDRLAEIAERTGAAGFVSKSNAGTSNLVVELRQVLYDNRDRVARDSERPPIGDSAGPGGGPAA